MATTTSKAIPHQSTVSRWRRWLDSDTFTAYLFLAVPMLIFIVIKFYPVFYNIFLSFTNYDLFSPLEFTGLKSYQEIFTQETTLKAIRNTILYTIGTVPLGTALSLVIAYLLNQQIRGRVFFRTMYYLPVITSVVVYSLVWRLILNPQFGLLNYLLSFIGIPPQQWLGDPRLALPSIIFITIWVELGKNMVIFLAGLQTIPPELYESASLDGAKGWQSFLYVTVPMLRPVILFVVVTYCIFIFRNFGIIFMLTEGGPALTTNTLVWEIYQNAFGYLRIGKAAAISVVLLVIILIITAVNFRLLSEETE